MKVFIYVVSGQEQPQASTTARTAAQSIGISERTLWQWIKQKGYYHGNKGKVWTVEVEKCKRKGYL
jgi:phage antirepressor YoqD-like protein